ncbi:LppA family lipoprotein [Mycobacterium sp. 3519A]|jgi:ABC-type glycerol-3-phosphate transport system substrate-binding protein|uniref:LppA family lipoprotein n=1 Tax=Mycobacterium sp. 3519A TaxID=2057184 RepID=UPI000C7AB235|nr:LppA family lipoprotein [Mycobacterium sp. 3519A]
MTRRKLAAGLLIGALCIAACGSSTSTGETSVTSADPTQLEQKLQSKPSLETAQTDYQAAVQKMAAAIAALTPGTTWQIEQTTWVGCGGDYAQTKGKQAYVMAVFSGPIPDNVWPQAVQIVKDGAAQQGATEFGTFKDNPGDHDIYIAGPDGVEFRLGTQKASTLTAKSDCRLSQADAAPR